MTEAKVIEIHKEKPKKKVRIDPIKPTDIVDVWRLYKASLTFGNQAYPDCTEEPDEILQSSLFNYLARPNFAGLIARSGKKPVGIILGHLEQRAFGRPKRFAFVWCFWMDPAHRKNGFGLAKGGLWEEYTSRLKKVGIMHWEANVHPHLEKEIIREGSPVQKLLTTVGGRL